MRTVVTDVGNDSPAQRDVFHRARPEPLLSFIDAQQYSFPSGHASDVLAGYVAGLIWTDAVILAGHLLPMRPGRRAA